MEYPYPLATLGGLANDNTEWKSIYYAKPCIMPQWRYAIINLLRETYKAGELVLPPEITNYQQFNSLLDTEYQKFWNVHFAKPTTNSEHTIGYLGRYITRPPLAMSRLKHYDGTNVVFKYLNHKTKTFRLFTCKVMEFIERFIQHIPEKGFRLIRYYGFLANSVRSKRLPVVYKLLDQLTLQPDQIRYPALLKKSFGLDPLLCILCYSTLVFKGITRGVPLVEVYSYHNALAQNRK